DRRRRRRAARCAGARDNHGRQGRSPGMKEKWKQALIPPQATVGEAIRAIDQSGVQIALVVDAAQVLRGTVTDGDVRRGLLRGVGTGDAVSAIMNAKPTTVADDERSARVL